MQSAGQALRALGVKKNLQGRFFAQRFSLSAERAASAFKYLSGPFAPAAWAVLGIALCEYPYLGATAKSRGDIETEQCRQEP